MQKNLYGLLLMAVFLSACELQNSQLSEGKPNILLLIADDMGYQDLECYGGVPNTPNINSLAKNGTLFTDFYAAAPNCSPSRAGLLTGKSPAITGIYNYRPFGHPMHLRGSEITIAEILMKQGYTTSHFGKWHLGSLPQDSILNHPQPIDQGFEYSFGTENNARPSHLNPTNFIRNGTPEPNQAGYSCHILADEVVNWMSNIVEKGKPFFSYVAFHEPHAKIASPPELVKKYSNFPLKDGEYLANIENLDLAVGKIIDYLQESNLLESTLIIFASDNGSYRQASNGNLRAVKSYLYDGGIRVPGIISWPALNQKGQVVSEPVGFVDIMPTVCDLLKIELPQKNLDGTSILGLRSGGKINRTKPLYWHFYRTSPEIAVRIDDFMILGKDIDTIPRTHRFSQPDMTYLKNMDIIDFELYDLTIDEGQHNNIIETHPKATLFKKVLIDQLVEIQKNGYHWKDLPAAIGTKRNKINWVPYER